MEQYKTNPWTIILTALITAAVTTVIVGGGIHLWSQTQAPVVEKVSKQPEWKTFTLDREGGFNFQYPDGWIAVSDQFVRSSDWTHLEKGAEFMFLIDPSGMGFEYLVNDLGSSSVYLDNVLVTKNLRSDESGKIIAAIIEFNKSGHSYWFKYEFVADNEAEKDYYFNILDKIINTFKFSD
jgi:hypothetical protein